MRRTYCDMCGRRMNEATITKIKSFVNIKSEYSGNIILDDVCNTCIKELTDMIKAKQDAIKDDDITDTMNNIDESMLNDVKEILKPLRTYDTHNEYLEKLKKVTDRSIF